MTDLLELARALIRLDSANPPGGESAAAALVAGRLEAAGFAVDRHEPAPGRTSVVARWPAKDDGGAICLTGHLDTVPLGDAPWTVDPLGAELDGDRLYGRGSSDMKAGVAALVMAAERVARLGRGTAGMEVVLCAGEETGCEGARELARAPDALGTAAAVLVAEPTANYPCLAHKGAVWLEARTAGRSAHGSMPHLGVNAVYAIARAISKLEDLDFGQVSHPLLGEPTLNVGRVSGGRNINSVPDSATAGIDIRIVPGQDPEEVVGLVGSQLGAGVELATLAVLPPVATDPDDAWVGDVFDVMASVLGERPTPRGVSYFTDASALSPAYGEPPTVICGPGEPSQAHATDEWCSVQSLEAAYEGYVETVRRRCGL